MLSRVFFIKFDELDQGETILIDNIEFLTDYTTAKLEITNFPSPPPQLELPDPFNPWTYIKGFFTYPPWQDPVWNGPRVSLVYEDHDHRKYNGEKGSLVHLQPPQKTRVFISPDHSHPGAKDGSAADASGQGWTP